MLAGNHLTICQFTREETGAFRLIWDGVEFLKKDKPNALGTYAEILCPVYSCGC